MTGLPLLHGRVVRCGHRGCLLILVSNARHIDLPEGYAYNRGRGLCGDHYALHHQAGSLDLFPRATRTSGDVLEEWDRLRRDGRTRKEAAAAMRITVAALDKVIERGVLAGDERAVWAPRSRHPNSLDAAQRAVTQRRPGWPRHLHI